ncbi:MAG: PKD domain-containing protein [Candidatus Pacebacteria bacterium]|nr:PKD domain-containing protein [Candidatus Paceibacterota bacterium]MBP9840380.1 PKD domain-containing protein [Candidatus Paceibacterota bacterium]
MNKKAELPRFLVVLLVALAIIAGVSFALRDSGMPHPKGADADAKVNFDADRFVKPGSKAPAVPEASDENNRLRAIPASGKAPLTVTFLPAYAGDEAHTLEFGDESQTSVTCLEKGLETYACARMETVVHTYKKPGTYTVFYREGNDVLAKLTIVAY